MKKKGKKLGLWGGKVKKAAKKAVKLAKKQAKKGWSLKGKAKKLYGKRRKAQKKKAKKALKAKVAGLVGAGSVWKKIWKVQHYVTNVSRACTAKSQI